MPYFRQHGLRQNMCRRLFIGGVMLALILLFSESSHSNMSRLISISLGYTARGIKKNILNISEIIDRHSMLDAAIPQLKRNNPSQQDRITADIRIIMAVLHKQFFCWGSPRIMLQSQLPLLALKSINIKSPVKPFSFHPRPVGVPYLLNDHELQNIPRITINEIRYHQIENPSKILAWLSARHSMEAAPGYLKALDEAGKQFDVNPLLLLAITGQEQSFVPVNAYAAREMIKNPFNVYYSWQVFAPGFDKAALIAAQTVKHLSYGCPGGMNPIHWIDSPDNPRSRYAQDTNWWRGVSIFLAQLESLEPKENQPENVKKPLNSVKRAKYSSAVPSRSFEQKNNNPRQLNR